MRWIKILKDQRENKYPLDLRQYFYQKWIFMFLKTVVHKHKSNKKYIKKY